MPTQIDTLIVGPLEVNCYVISDSVTHDGVVIDPGDDAAHIVNHLNRKKIRPVAIMLTHAHGDHIGAVVQLAEHFKAPVLCGRGEEGLLADPARNMSLWLESPIVGPEPDQLLDDEQVVRFGSLEFRVLATPGHSPGGVCYLMEKENVLFCGDTLFQGSIGRTDFPGCSLEQLLGSIKRKILTLPDGIICYPGHGPATTVGAERVNNPFLTGAYFA